MAAIMTKLGLVSLLASTILAMPTHHNRHRLAKRDIVWETDVVTDVNVVTDVVYATALAAAAAPASANVLDWSEVGNHVASSAAAAPSAAAKVNILEWNEVGNHVATSAAAAAVTVSAVQKQAAASHSPAATSAPAPVSSAAPTTASTSSASTGTGSSSGGKRGVAYNSIADANIFTSSAFSWAYNWASSPSGTLLSSLEYVPMLWGGSSTFTSAWTSAVSAALSSGSTYILGFNEPDHSEQANMSPSDAAAAWQQYIQPYSSKAKLVSPAVTNGAAPMGLAWMSDFMSACDGCTFDAVAIHWYDAATNVAYFKQHIIDAHTQTGKPVWLTEFGATGSDDEISTFLAEVLPWLDSQDFVERYAYFMAKDGTLLSGTSLSSYGKTYVDTQ